MRTHKPGVYKIINSTNGKFYIGSSSRNVHQRCNDHRSQLRTGIHPNIHLQRSYNKYGLKVFVFEVLEYCENVLEREQYYIDTLKPQYNIETIAGNSCGIKRRPETCAKIGKSKLGNKNRLGKGFTNDIKKQISDTLKKGYQSGSIKHWNQGKKMPNKQKKAQSKRVRGNSYRKDNPTYHDFEKLHKDTLKVLGKYSTSRKAADAVNAMKKEESSRIIHACRTGQVAFGYRWRSSSVQVKSDELLESLQ